MQTAGCRAWALLVASGLLLPAEAIAGVVYVDLAATGANNGSSWVDAYVKLQTALADAQSGDELWVANGTYRPAVAAGPRSDSFKLKTGVAVFGGFEGADSVSFPGGETQRSQRDSDPLTNGTVLSGDLAADDTGGLSDPSRDENAYHVVVGSSTDATAVLDGFTVTGGNADGVSPHDAGGGMLNLGGSPTARNCVFDGNQAFAGGGIFNNPTSNPTLSNCTFTGNSADFGGGIRNNGASPKLTSCTFNGNSASSGGGMSSVTASSPMLTRCTLIGNSAGTDGGGMHNDASSPVLTNCIFSGNSALNGGGMTNRNSSNVVLTNCIFSGNSADFAGGGVYNYSDSLVTLTNCSLSRNSSTTGGGAYNDSGADAVLTNCILWLNVGGQIIGNAVNASYSLVQGGFSGTGNIDADPRFADADGIDNTLGTPDDDLRLLPGSPAIDAGANAALPADTADLDGDSDTAEQVPFDLAGMERRVAEPTAPDTGAGTPPIVDMGVLEFPDARVAFSSAESSVSEDDGAHALTVVLTTGTGRPALWPVLVSFETEDETATSADDYVPESFLLGFPPGTSSGSTQTFSVSVLNDSSFEQAETFNVNLMSPVHGVLRQPSAHTVTILDDDPVPTSTPTRTPTPTSTATPTLPPAGGLVYVDQSATGANDGTSWANAYVSLQSALEDPNDPNEIWVANGRYMPADPNGPRTRTFQLEGGVAVFGGFDGADSISFPGGETQRSQRDSNPLTNGTVLSGDLAGDDTGGLSDPSHDENSYHVVTGSGADATAVLDGFTVTGGNADGVSPHDAGGGMLDLGGSPTVRNCVFDGNQAFAGGGIFNNATSNPTLSNCTFSSNSATFGGGIRNNNGAGPTLTSCIFSGNSALTSGGGMSSVAGSRPKLTHCSFSGNTAGSDGGGMHNDASSPVLTNCSFSGNSASAGGGVNNRNFSSPVLTNCSFSGNSASQSGGGMFNEGSPVLTNCSFSGNSGVSGGGMVNVNGITRLTNCILWQNAGGQISGSLGLAFVRNSLVQGGFAGTGNIDADPLFVDTNGLDNTLGTPDDDLRLLSGSPAIDVGQIDVLPADTADLDGDGNTSEPLPLDLAGSSRVIDDPSVADPNETPRSAVDMGAHEFAAVNVALSGSAGSVAESAGSSASVVELTTTSGLPTTSAVLVPIATADGTALDPQDYFGLDASFTFPAGTASGSTRSLFVAILDDSIEEPDEGFLVRIGSDHARVGVSAQTVTILDNDGPPPTSSPSATATRTPSPSVTPKRTPTTTAATPTWSSTPSATPGASVLGVAPTSSDGLALFGLALAACLGLFRRQRVRSS